MLKFRDINEDETISDIAKEMIKKVDIANFSKCVAAFAHSDLDNIDETVVKKYLLTWAKNKEHLYHKLNGELRKDIEINYDASTNYEQEFKYIARRYPSIAPWLIGFTAVTENKIAYRDMTYTLRDAVDLINPSFDKEAMKITSFLQKVVQAPEAAITDVARIFEATKVEGIYTISIDPVDMMLASENPYGWDSCYALGKHDGYADGCMASVLDAATMIGYVWTEVGKLKVEDYEMKNVRFKKARQWFSANKDYTIVHINKLYPKKNVVQPLSLVELLIKTTLEFFDSEVEWEQPEGGFRGYKRVNWYGYDEFSLSYQWCHKDLVLKEAPQIQLHSEEILCPCGYCSSYLPQREEDTVQYDGGGFVCENYSEEPWCEIGECSCPYAYDVCESNCEDCGAYEREYGRFCEHSEERCPSAGGGCGECGDCAYYPSEDEDEDDDSWRL